MSKLGRVLIWDLPTRLFHWLLVVGFSVAAVLALVVGDDGPLFPYHAILGLTLALMVVLRVFWGLVGSRYARFSSFAYGPRALLAYLRGVLREGGARHAGHNPGSAWAIFAMLGLILALSATGLLLGLGNEAIEELHELLAYSMVGVAVLHVLGVALHTVRQRENITASMIHGRKEAEAGAGITAQHYVAATVFLVLSCAWAWGLLASYDAASRSTKLPVIGVSVQLGEAEDDRHLDHPEGRDDDD